MNVIEAAEKLQEGKKVICEMPTAPVHLNEVGMLAFDDGTTPPVHILDLLSDKWTVVDE